VPPSRDATTIEDGGATFTPDPKARPAAVDIRGPRAGKSVTGICVLHKVKRAIWCGLDGGERPKESKSDVGSNPAPILLERAKK
jgi:hypothetical protein